MNGRIRLRQRGTFFIFSQKSCSMSNFFGKRWFNFNLFGEKVVLRATFSPKRMSGTTLPEAE